MCLSRSHKTTCSSLKRKKRKEQPACSNSSLIRVKSWPARRRRPGRSTSKRKRTLVRLSSARQTSFALAPSRTQCETRCPTSSSCSTRRTCSSSDRATTMPTEWWASRTADSLTRAVTIATLPCRSQRLSRCSQGRCTTTTQMDTEQPCPTFKTLLSLATCVWAPCASRRPRIRSTTRMCY